MTYLYYVSDDVDEFNFMDDHRRCRLIESVDHHDALMRLDIATDKHRYQWDGLMHKIDEKLCLNYMYS